MLPQVIVRGIEPTTILAANEDRAVYVDQLEKALEVTEPPCVPWALAREFASKSPVVTKLARDSFMPQNDFEYRPAIENEVETIFNM